MVYNIGLAGALVPGPMLFATIETSMKNGWTSGPLVVYGHALVEVLLYIFIVSGFSTLATQGAIQWISVIRGAVLVVFCILTIREGKHATLSEGSSMFKSPFAAGAITSVNQRIYIGQIKRMRI